jgi:hypothetical protein
MSFLKQSTCTVCKKKFVWKIQRPGDGYWDRWRSDDGDTFGSWFLGNNLCWDHAFETMPKKFRTIVRTELYEESEDKAQAA